MYRAALTAGEWGSDSEGQPRELFADYPQLVLRAGFVELVDQRDQRADILLAQLKELSGVLAGTKGAVAESRRLVMIRPPCLLMLPQPQGSFSSGAHFPQQNARN